MLITSKLFYNLINAIYSTPKNQSNDWFFYIINGCLLLQICIESRILLKVNGCLLLRGEIWHKY